jgi:flagellar hook-associated protein 2
VQQLIEIENQPIKAMQGRKAKEEARMKLFQEFKGKFSGLDKALSEMTTFRKLRELKVDLGDGANQMSVSVDKEKADIGQYQFEINQLAARNSLISNGFENPTENVFGPGSIRIETDNGEVTDITVGDQDSSLKGIAGAINREPKSPIRAAVIQDAGQPGTPWKLVLTAKKEGNRNQLQTPEFNFDNGPNINIANQHEAQNASISLDGFPVETDSNDVTDFLPGVNLHLKQASPDHPFAVTITEDYQKVSGKVKALVEQVNQILQFIGKQNTVDEKTDTSTTFAGDTGLQSLEFSLRNAIQQGFPGGDPKDSETQIVQMSQIGIEFERNGTVSFREDKFNKALEKNFTAIGEAISGPLGFANQLRNLLDGYTRVGSGMLSIREQGIRARIKTIDDQIEEKTRMVDQKRQQIVDQFSRLESSLGNLQRQQQQLSASLGGGGGSSISQLLGG